MRIAKQDGGVIVHLDLPEDAGIFRRVQGWLFWKEMRVYYARAPDGESRQATHLELVTSEEMYDAVLEVVLGRIRPAFARHEGHRSSRARHRPAAAAVAAQGGCNERIAE